MDLQFQIDEQETKVFNAAKAIALLEDAGYSDLQNIREWMEVERKKLIDMEDEMEEVRQELWGEIEN